jgi:hypothetical protein
MQSKRSITFVAIMAAALSEAWTVRLRVLYSIIICMNFIRELKEQNPLF